MSESELDVMGPVNYLVVEFPAQRANFTGEVAAELRSLIDRELVRVLDLIILRKDLEGEVEAVELHEIDESLVGELRELEAGLALLLAEQDVEDIGVRSSPAASGRCWCTRTAGRGRSARPCGGRAGNWWPTAASRPRRCWPRSRRTMTRRRPEMPLRPGRVGRPGVVGGPVTRTAAVVGTAAVVKHGHDRRDDAGATGAGEGARSGPQQA